MPCRQKIFYAIVIVTKQLYFPSLRRNFIDDQSFPRQQREENREKHYTMVIKLRILGR